MNIVAWLLMLRLLFGAAPAFADSAAYQTALELFDSSYFDKAAVSFERALAEPLTPAQQRRARLLLAECYFFDHHEAQARTQLRALLQLAPKQVLTSEDAPPAFVALFDDVKGASKVAEPKPEAKVVSEPRRVPPRRPSAPAEDLPLRPSDPATASAPAGAVTAPTPDTTTRLDVTASGLPGTRPWFVRMWPLGIGHFLNGDTAGGVGFLSSELVLIGANVGITVFNFGQRDAQGGFPHNSAYPTLYWVELGIGVAAYALVAFDVLDALLWSPGRVLAKKSVVILPTANGGAEVRFAMEWQ